LYRESDSFEQVILAAQKLMEQGLRVRMEREKPEEISCQCIYRFSENGLKEELHHA